MGKYSDLSHLLHLTKIMRQFLVTEINLVSGRMKDPLKFPLP